MKKMTMAKLQVAVLRATALLLRMAEPMWAMAQLRMAARRAMALCLRMAEWTMVLMNVWLHPKMVMDVNVVAMAHVLVRVKSVAKPLRVRANMMAFISNNLEARMA